MQPPSLSASWPSCRTCWWCRNFTTAAAVLAPTRQKRRGACSAIVGGTLKPIAACMMLWRRAWTCTKAKPGSSRRPVTGVRGRTTKNDQARNGIQLSALRATPMLLQRPRTRFFVRPAVHQPRDELLEARRQERVVPGFGVHQAHARSPVRPADAVIKHDPVVPGGRRPSDDHADLWETSLLDHAPAPELGGIDSPSAADSK